MSSSAASQSHPRSWDDVEDLYAAWRAGMAPTPRLSVPEWADQYRKLAKGFGAFSGQ